MHCGLCHSWPWLGWPEGRMESGRRRSRCSFTARNNSQTEAARLPLVPVKDDVPIAFERCELIDGSTSECIKSRRDSIFVSVFWFRFVYLSQTHRLSTTIQSVLNSITRKAWNAFMFCIFSVRWAPTNISIRMIGLIRVSSWLVQWINAHSSIVMQRQV